MNIQPTLSPLAYRLWLSQCRTYVQRTHRFNRRIVGTTNQAAALSLPEALALQTARKLIRGTGQVIELRPVAPASAEQAGKP